MYFKRDNFIEALSEFYLGIRTNPREFTPDYDLAVLLNGMAQKEEAVKEYNQALKLTQRSDDQEVSIINARLQMLER